MSADPSRDELSALSDTSETRGAEAVAELAGRVWYLYLLAGVVAVIFGVLVLSDVFAGLAVLVWLAGLYLLYAGIVDLTSASYIRPRWLSALMGILAIAGGVAALSWPGVTLRALAWLLGISFVVWGVARLLLALRSRGEGWVWLLIGGIASVVVGLIAMVYPGLTVFALGVLLGVNSLLWGVFAIVQAFAMRKLGRQWRKARNERRVAV
jgi:uncharacterized membrane protein HdeD (DUF308 family)